MIRSALMVALTATTLAAQGFEGSITMKRTSTNGDANEMTYLVKGGKLRIDTPTGGMIIDGAAQKMLMVMTPQKMYVEIDMQGIASSAEGKTPPKVTHTGKMETIAGYQCEHILITGDGDTGDVCMAKGLARFMVPSAGRGGMSSQPAWVQALGESGFPLKVERDGKVEMEATKIEKKSLDAALFTAPEGFTKMDMPGRGRRGGGVRSID